MIFIFIIYLIGSPILHLLFNQDTIYSRYTIDADDLLISVQKYIDETDTTRKVSTIKLAHDGTIVRFTKPLSSLLHNGAFPALSKYTTHHMHNTHSSRLILNCLMILMLSIFIIVIASSPFPSSFVRRSPQLHVLNLHIHLLHQVCLF